MLASYLGKLSLCTEHPGMMVLYVDECPVCSMRLSSPIKFSDAFLRDDINGAVVIESAKSGTPMVEDVVNQDRIAELKHLLSESEDRCVELDLKLDEVKSDLYEAQSAFARESALLFEVNRELGTAREIIKVLEERIDEKDEHQKYLENRIEELCGRR